MFHNVFSTLAWRKKANCPSTATAHWHHNCVRVTLPIVIYRTFVTRKEHRREKDFIKTTKQNGGVETGPVHINVELTEELSMFYLTSSVLTMIQ